MNSTGQKIRGFSCRHKTIAFCFDFSLSFYKSQTKRFDDFVNIHKLWNYASKPVLFYRCCYATFLFRCKFKNLYKKGFIKCTISRRSSGCCVIVSFCAFIFYGAIALNYISLTIHNMLVIIHNG